MVEVNNGRYPKKKFPALSLRIRGKLETAGFKVVSVRRATHNKIKITLRDGDPLKRMTTRKAAFEVALEVVRQYEGDKPKIDVEIAT